MLLTAGGGRVPGATAACYALILAVAALPAAAGEGTDTSAVNASASRSATVGDEARAWLARSDQALARRNYRGVFVHELHEYGGETETLRVVHRVGSDGVSERLVSMDGSGREFIRRAGLLSCYLPDLRTVLVVKSSQPTLPLNVPQIDGTWAGQYNVRQVAVARILGHRARVIAVTPLDALRYGYRVWIDDTTAMPLKTQLRDRHGAVLEQIVFTQLTLPVHIADSELRPEIDARKYHWVQQYSSAPTDPTALGAGGTDAGLQPASWQANALPAGFRLTASHPQVLSSGPAEHLVFSDGLASVSVFIQRARAGRNVRITDAATLGTSSAYSVVTAGYRITAVGEVPPQTVRAIAESIRGTAVGQPPRNFGASPGMLPASTGGMPPTFDLDGNGALLILGRLGNGNLGNGSFGAIRAGSGVGFDTWPLLGPRRIEPPPQGLPAPAAAPK